MKKKGFLRNTIVMFFAMFITKGLGAVLKIPLGNILGGTGMGYFTTAYSIFTPALAFACSGVPTIVTQVTAQYSSSGRLSSLAVFRKGAVLLSILIGLAGTAAVYICAVPFACLIANSPESLPSVLMIAPAVLFCSVTAVYRGYFEGLSDMLPTATSQVIEAVVKAAVGIGLSYFVYTRGSVYLGSAEKALPYAAAGAIIGVAFSELCGTIYITLRARRKSDSLREYAKPPKKGELSAIMRDIFVRSLPVAFGAVAANLISFTDMLTVSNCINISLARFSEYFYTNQILSAALSQTNDLGNFLYGCYSGMVLSVYMLATALTGLISRCSLPRLICAIETEDKASLHSAERLMIKGTAFISIPVSFVIAVLAEPVLGLLYPYRTVEAAIGVAPLQLLCLGSIFAGLGGALFVLFQAHGDFKTPVKITLMSGAVKLLLNALLLVPFLNISGAALSAVGSNIFAVIYGFRKLKRSYGMSVSLFSEVFPSLLAGAVCAATAFVCYNGFILRFSSFISLALSAVVAAIAYLFIIFLADSGDFTAAVKIITGKMGKGYCKKAENSVK